MKKKSIILFSVFFCIYIHIILNEVQFVQNNNITFLVFSLITIVLFFINLFILLNKNLEISKKFGILVTPLGIFLILCMPVLHGIDEVAHFFKVYSFFYNQEIVYNDENELIDKVPVVIIDISKVNKLSEQKSFLDRKIDESDTILTDKYIGAKLYSSISYITYLLPMFLCKKILNMDIYWIIIIGRMFSFFMWIIVSMYTIKIMPRKKELFAFLLMTPINLTLVTTYTGDLVTNSAIFLFIAIWYRLYTEKRPIKQSEIIVISVLGIISAFAKIVYALIFLLILLLPKENFENTKKRINTVCIILGSIIIAFLLNITVVGRDLMAAYPAIEDQKEFVQNNFLMYISIFVATIITMLPTYIFQFTTGFTTMCQNTISVNELISVLYWCVIICSLFLEESKIKISKKDLCLIITIIVIIISIIFLSLYLQWTATNYGIGYGLIQGVQGRYFMPLAIFLIFINKRKCLKIDTDYLWSTSIIINFIVISKILIEFLG